MAMTSDPLVTSAELLQKAVAGDAGWNRLRAIVTDPQRHGGPELREQIPEQLAQRRLELVRSKYKPGRKLTAYYRVTKARRTAGTHLAVSWLADGRVRSLRFPVDPDMPQLTRLSDPAVLAALVETFHGPSYARRLPVVQTLRYRPGQRHVLVARSTCRPPVYVKTDRAGSGARAVPVARFLAAALERECPHDRVAEPLGYATHDKAALWWGANGRLATTRIADDRGGAALAALVGRVARVIHDSPKADSTPPGPEFLGVHDIDVEAEVTLRAGEHIVALLPSVGTVYRRLVDGVLAELDRLPEEPVTLVHGDLKLDNLLVDHGALRVLDLDRARWAEPAHDLAKFLADLRWSSRPAHIATLEAAFRAGYGECDPGRWARAELLASLVQVRLAARRVALHDRDWPVRVRIQVARAGESFTRARRA